MSKKYVLSVGLLTLFTMLGVVSLSTYAAGEKDTLAVGLQDDAASLDPAQAYEITSWGLISQTFESDAEKRKELYQQITETILDDGPFVILYTPTKQYGIRLEVMEHVGVQSALAFFPNLR